MVGDPNRVLADYKLVGFCFNITPSLRNLQYSVPRKKQHKNDGRLPCPLESFVIYLLKRVRTRWSEKFYYAIAKITAMSAVLVPLLRDQNGKIEVFLTPRNDYLYKNMLHLGSSRVRASDKEGFFPDAIDRVVRGEYADVSLTSITQAGVTVTKAASGMEITVVLFAETSPGAEPKVEGMWFDVTKLPKNFINHELNGCKLAVSEYCRKHNLGAVEPGLEK